MVLRRQRIDPNEATSRVWQNRCITKELVQWRMNEVNAVGHQRIDPNGGDQPKFGKIDASQKAGAMAHERSECGSAPAHRSKRRRPAEFGKIDASQSRWTDA
jgi:hypothetical protein